MIEATDLRKQYRSTAALDGFSLRVEAGEIVGLVGPNGAGKTTLIKILATLLRHDSGRAAIAGHDVVGQPRAVRAVLGYLPDVPGLYSDMRVAEFFEFFADAFHIKGGRRAAAVERALARSGLSARRDEFVEHLSLGMKQKLVLARTLLHEPRVLLLDEPATGLDPLARIELRELIKALNREGVTILISSHILSDLEDICTRIVLIAAGRNITDHAQLASGAPNKPLVCEIEFLGDADAVLQSVRAAAAARVVNSSGQHVRVEVQGGREEASALLRFLVGQGVRIVRFDPREASLEDRYREVFGGPAA